MFVGELLPHFLGYHMHFIIIQIIIDVHVDVGVCQRTHGKDGNVTKHSVVGLLKMMSVR